MIIRRQYEILGIIAKRDPKAKTVIDRICKDLDSELRESILSPYTSLTLYNADLGCGLPGKMFNELLEEFNKLDEIDPYDNGLNYRDVTCIDYEPSKKGSAIKLIMKCKRVEMPERIVSVVAIERKSIIEDWGYRKPIHE